MIINSKPSLDFLNYSVRTLASSHHPSIKNMPEIKKVVIKVNAHDDNDMRKAFKAVSGLSGIDSLSKDMKDKKLTIVGAVDPVCVARKLKKWRPSILAVGPVKEEKKEAAKKEPEKKGKEEEEEAVRRWMEACRVYNPYPPPRYCVHSMEEDPNSCVIC